MANQKYLMMVCDEVPETMIDISIEPEEDLTGWKPVEAIINDRDLDVLEGIIGFKLPLSYRAFLMYKHWFDLKIPDLAVTFPDHLPDKHVLFLQAYVHDYMLPEFVIGKGYIYFADFEDYGMLCFDTRREVENYEYPVIFMHHEDFEDVHVYAQNFLELLEGDAEKGNRFIEYLNDHYNSNTQ